MAETDRGAVAGVILAAGAGTRFGGPKALAPFDGSTLVERAVRTLADAGCVPVIVVAGPAADAVREACRTADARVVMNASWADGLSGSVRLGLETAAGVTAAAAAVLFPVDQPIVSAALVARLVDAWNAGARAAVAAFGGEARTPVLLDASLWAEVSAHTRGDAGARTYLRAHPEIVTLVDCDDVGDADDIDTPADLARLEARVGSSGPRRLLRPAGPAQSAAAVRCSTRTSKSGAR
jgi:CTP:molybdopterin cytidylyltransferase MocA